MLAELAQREDFRGLPRAKLVAQVAELYDELNIVHPFREDNGRTLRLFFEHLILVCGFAISWQRVYREEWISASIAAVNCDYGPLTKIFDRCIGDKLE